MMQTVDPSDVPEVPTQEPVVHDQLPSVEEARMSGSGRILGKSEVMKAVPPVSSDGNQLPSVEEVRLNSSRSLNDSPRKKKLLVWGSIGLIVLTALVIGLTVGLSNKNSSSGGSNTSAESGPNDESSNARYEEVIEFLINEQISNKFQLSDMGTPQQLAADFVADSDASLYPIPTSLSASDSFPFVQRYALAVIFYSLGGPGWKFDLNFLSKETECLWYSMFVGTGGLFRVGVTCDQDTGKVVGLRLSGNGLQGQFPSEVSLLRSLVTLSLHFNAITGAIPFSMQLLTNLEWLTLHYNALDGSLPTWFDRLSKLRVLALANNEFTGPLPATMATLTDMELLALDDNFLTGDISVVESMTKLQALYLEDNQFTGVIDDSFLTDMPALQQLDLSGNTFTGSVPVHLFKMDFLEVIDLHGNQLKGSLPEIPKNTFLKILTLHDNEISGPIPDSIQNLQVLWHLDLASNKFTGDINPALGNMTRLNYLFLANNDFDSSIIPDFLQKLTVLEELSLKNTTRSGEIPDWLGSLEQLLLLDLDGNSLKGPIPSTLGNLTKLRFLLLNRNQLDGEVPTELQELPALDMLRLESNSLTGSTGLLGCEETFKISVFVADCELNCTCCTSCCGENGEGCNDDELLANNDPIWERQYDRDFFVFSDETVFDKEDLVPPP